MPMFGKLFVRDLAIVGLTAWIWHLAAGASANAGLRGDFAGVLAGVTIGVCGYLLHEWGHLLGAIVAGSAVKPGRSLAAGFLFSFDSHANTRRQFLALSLGGWLATAVVLWGVYALLPDDLFATRVARGVVAGNVLLVVLIEIPLVVYALVTGHVPPVENQPGTAATAAAAE
ncbi:hypothetical protein K2Z84_12220 [Candidatus Binatia bacterium]|jgi:hypothetical protein|nr:hypothetical protein [Candidatus Binatia bacterium]